MRIYNEDDNIMESPDMNLGRLEKESQPVVFRYDVTKHEQGHFETVAEYPNGGKDVEWVVDVPEEGCWNAYGEDGSEVDTDIEIPEDAPHEMDVPAEFAFYRYILYTEDELAEIAEQKAQAEQAEAKAADRQAMLDAMPALFSAFGKVE